MKRALGNLILLLGAVSLLIMTVQGYRHWEERRKVWKHQQEIERLEPEVRRLRAQFNKAYSDGASTEAIYQELGPAYKAYTEQMLKLILESSDWNEIGEYVTRLKQAEKDKRDYEAKRWKR